MNFLLDHGRRPDDPLFYRPVPDPEAMFDFETPILESHFSHGYMKRLFGYFEENGMKIKKEVIHL